MWQAVCSLLLLRVSERGNVREGSNRVSFLGDIQGRNILGGSVRVGFFFLGVDCPGGNYPEGS